MTNIMVGGINPSDTIHHS